MFIAWVVRVLSVLLFAVGAVMLVTFFIDASINFIKSQIVATMILFTFIALLTLLKTAGVYNVIRNWMWPHIDKAMEVKNIVQTQISAGVDHVVTTSMNVTTE